MTLQVLNLAPWDNVLLQLPPVRLSGAHGWSSLGTSLGDQWLKEITTNQVSKISMCAHQEWQGRQLRWQIIDDLHLPTFKRLWHLQ